MKNLFHHVLIGILLIACTETNGVEQFRTIVRDSNQACQTFDGVTYKAMQLTNSERVKKIVVTYAINEEGQNARTETLNLEPGEITYVCIPPNATLCVVGER
jgi:hypothetical protein